MGRLTLFELRWPRILVAAACLAAPPLGLLYGVKFLSHLQLNIEPPASSAAYKAMQSFKAAFPLQAANTEDSFILQFATQFTRQVAITLTLEASQGPLLRELIKHHCKEI